MSEDKSKMGSENSFENLKTLLSRFQNKKKQLILFNSTVVILTLLILLFWIKSYYTSTVTILPDVGKKSTLTQFSDLASMIGINIGEVGGTEIYKNLVTSETVLTPVIYSKYITNEFPDSVNLIEYFEIENYDDEPAELRRRNRFLDIKEILLENIVTELDKKTKILTLKVTMPESKLSADVANKIVWSLDQYLRNKTKFHAREQRIYLEKRISQVKDSLFIAEERLKNFRERNRVIQNSPSLLLEQQRLLRDVEILQTVYAELNKHLELAKIEEVKDTPILNLVEYANEPVKKAGPPKLLILIFVMLLSLITSSVYVIFYPRYKNIYSAVLPQISLEDKSDK